MSLVPRAPAEPWWHQAALVASRCRTPQQRERRSPLTLCAPVVPPAPLSGIMQPAATSLLPLTVTLQKGQSPLQHPLGVLAPSRLSLSKLSQNQEGISAHPRDLRDCSPPTAPRVQQCPKNPSQDHPSTNQDKIQAGISNGSGQLATGTAQALRSQAEATGSRRSSSSSCPKQRLPQGRGTKPGTPSTSTAPGQPEHPGDSSSFPWRLAMSPEKAEAAAVVPGSKYKAARRFSRQLEERGAWPLRRGRKGFFCCFFFYRWWCSKRRVCLAERGAGSAARGLRWSWKWLPRLREEKRLHLTRPLRASRATAEGWEQEPDTGKCGGKLTFLIAR